MKVAAGFIVFRRVHGYCEYLLLKASYGQKHWTPPKGHVDPGEKAEETALRETMEEAGFKEENLKIDWDYRKDLYYNVDGNPKTVHYWLAELADPTTPVILSEEHTEFKWLNFEDSLIYSKYKDMQEVMTDINQHLSSK